MQLIRWIREHYFMASVILITLAFHFFTLMRYPTPHGDEAWMASRAWAFLQTGNAFGPLDSGVIDRFSNYQYFFPWLPTVIQSLAFSLFDEPSLFAIRFTSLVAGIILLIAVYGIGFAWEGKKLGLFCVAFTAFSWPFFLSAHFGRPDIIAAAFGFGAIAIHLNNRKANIWFGIMAGLLAGLAFEIHAFAAVYIPVMASLYFWKYRWKLFRKTDTWGFLLGAILALVIYLILHVLPDPQAFIKLNRLIFTSTRTPPILTFNFSLILNAFKEMFLMVLTIYPQIVIAIWGIIKLMRKRVPYSGILFVINAVLLISFSLLVRNKFLNYYAILYTPALCLILAAFFYDFLKKPVKTITESRVRQFIVIGICLLLIYPVLKSDAFPAYQRVQTQVNQAIKPGDVIMANQLYWFGLTDHIYYSWENLIYHRNFQPNSSLEEAFQALKPDIFIMDGHLENFIFDGKHSNQYIQELRISESELESFLDQNAHLETKIEDGDGTPIMIYRINWEKPNP